MKAVVGEEALSSEEKVRARHRIAKLTPQLALEFVRLLFAAHRLTTAAGQVREALRQPGRQRDARHLRLARPRVCVTLQRVGRAESAGELLRIFPREQLNRIPGKVLDEWYSRKPSKGKGTQDNDDEDLMS